MSWFDDIKEKIQEMLFSNQKRAKTHIPKVDPRRQAIVELIRQLRQAEDPEAQKKILDDLSDLDKHPKEIIWQIVHGSTIDSSHYATRDKWYIHEIVWRLNDLGSGRYFASQHCNYLPNAHEIVSTFSEQAICGLIEGLSHGGLSKYSDSRDGFYNFGPLLICLGPRIIPILEYHLHSNKIGLSEEAANVIAAIKTLWNDNGEKAAKCFMDNEVYKSRGSLQIIDSFNAEAMHYLIKNIRALKETYERRGIELENPLCARLIEAKEKSLPFLREAAASEVPEIAEEAIALIREIEKKLSPG